MSGPTSTQTDQQRKPQEMLAGEFGSETLKEQQKSCLTLVEKIVQVYAIQKAIDHVHHKFEDNSTKAKDFVIFTDSKSTLQALEGSELDESLEEIIQKANKFTSAYPVKLKLQWIPGHVGIYGNEKADALAKKGSQNTQPTIPITFTTAKQKIKQAYRKEWMRHWENGSTGRQVYAHMKTIKPKTI